MQRFIAIVVGLAAGLYSGVAIIGIVSSLSHHSLRGMRADDPGEAELWDPTTEAWSPAGQTTRARNGHAAVRVAGDRVLVMGNAQFDDDGAAEIWDPATRTWSHERSGVGTHDPRVRALPNGEALVFGGPELARRSATGAWSLVAGPVGGRAACLTADGALVVADTEGNVAVHETDGGWRQLEPAPKNFWYLELLLRPDGRVMLVSGSGRREEPRLLTIDPLDGGWERRGEAGFLQEANLDANVDGAVVLADGEVLMVGVESAGAMLWDPKTNLLRWRVGPAELHRGAAWASIGKNELLIVFERAAVIWNPVSNQTRPAKAPRHGRTSNPTLTALSDGRALLVGGWSMEKSFYPDAPVRLARMIGAALSILVLAVMMFRVRALQRGQIAYVLAALVGLACFGGLLVSLMGMNPFGGG